MVTYKDNTRFQRHWPWWRWTIMGLNILALALSVVMSWHFLKGGSMIGCGSGSPCEQVLSSQWSAIAGTFPVSGLAMGIYLAMLVAGLFIGDETEAAIRRLAWQVMLIMAGSVAGSAIWFTFLQKWVIKEFCPYCMSTHIAGFLLATLIIWQAVKEFDNRSKTISQKKQKMTKKNFSPTTPESIIRPIQTVGMVFIGIILAGILAAFQVVFTPSAVYHDGESKDNLPIVDYRNVPIIGSSDAPYVVKLLFDYQCPHCQKIHFMLDDVVRRYAGKLAFVLCPTPLNTQCNPYIPRDVDAFKNSCELTRIGLAVWVAKRDAFPVFENWMFSFESGDSWHPRSLEAAQAKAVELVGQEKFDNAWSDPWIGKYMQTCIQIFGQTLQSGKGGIPKLIFGSRWVIPQPQNEEDLIQILKNGLEVPLP